jgi:hypothetical protein
LSRRFGALQQLENVYTSAFRDHRDCDFGRISREFEHCLQLDHVQEKVKKFAAEYKKKWDDMREKDKEHRRLTEIGEAKSDERNWFSRKWSQIKSSRENKNNDVKPPDLESLTKVFGDRAPKEFRQVVKDPRSQSQQQEGDNQVFESVVIAEL